jgi:hypothetical protein
MLSERQQMADDIAKWLRTQNAWCTSPLPLAPRDSMRIEVVSTAAEPVIRHLTSLGHAPRLLGAVKQFHPCGGSEMRPSGGPDGPWKRAYFMARVDVSTYALDMPETKPQPRHGYHGPDDSKLEGTLLKGQDPFAATEKQRGRI